MLESHCTVHWWSTRPVPLMKRRQSLRLLSLWAACCVWLAPSGAAAELKPDTVAAFDRYIQQVEARERQREQASTGFLWVDGAPERLRRVRAGETVTAPSGGQAMIEVPGGRIHDWAGAIFVPGVTLDQTLAVVQQYNRHKEWYKPEVIDSRLLERDGDHFRIYLRLLKKKVLTVVLDTDH